ncbi:MAG: hypothetical protein R3E83_16225 [Burkholderiaceae bacterium]
MEANDATANAGYQPMPGGYAYGLAMAGGSRQANQRTSVDRRQTESPALRGIDDIDDDVVGILPAFVADLIECHFW